MILVDTNVVIDYLRGRPSAIALLNDHRERIVFSSIVVAELYAGVRGDREIQVLDDLVAAFEVFSVNASIARIAGLYMRDYHAAHNIGLADAMIAATVEHHHTRLFTLNVRHFPMIQGLEPAYKV